MLKVKYLSREKPFDEQNLAQIVPLINLCLYILGKNIF